MDIRRILCPTDFSDASTPAVNQAVIMAGWYRARITALHVRSLEPIPPLTLEDTRQAVAAHCAAVTAAGIGLDILVDDGHPATRILERADSLPADMIVMGTHGASGFERLVLGSVTEKVLRKAACPVLTVPPRSQVTSRTPFKRVLCPVDFSESSLEALQYALSLARESDGTLTILHIIEWPWEEPPPPRLGDLPIEQRAALGEYRRYCEETATARLESSVPDSIPRSRAATRVRHGKAHVEILSVAAEEGSDLIVIGVHGRNPVDVRLLGSTTNQVVRRATCPVLTLRHDG